MAGGARIGAGRTPDPNALRRDRKDDAGWTTLPAEGRLAAAPSWPLIDPLPRELQLWTQFWAKPQALIWEKSDQTFTVAMHIRTLAEAEITGANTNLRTLLRQQANELLLTIPAMLSARVKIADVVENDVPAEVADIRQASKRLSARDRLKVVESGDQE